MKKYLLLILCSSFIFPLTFSRIVTTIDPSSKYTRFQEDLSSGDETEEENSTSTSFSFAYEHSFVNKEIFHFYSGGEFMLSRSALENISLHSIYIKPAVSMTENVLLFFKLGYCFLNAEDKDFPVENGLMVSAGFEYQITDRLSLGLSHSSYDLFEETGTNPSGDPWAHQNFEDDALPDTKCDLKYNKIGFSIIYGFDLDKE